MSAFDAKIRVGEIGIQLARESEDELALEAEVVLGVIALIPVGPGQAAPLPMGNLRIPMDKKGLASFGQQAIDASEQMKEPSPIEIAESLDGVDRVQQFNESIKQ